MYFIGMTRWSGSPANPGPHSSHVGRFNTEDDIDAAIDQVIADMSAQSAQMGLGGLSRARHARFG
ncbi:MAG: hypothetical protein R2873_11075 [Caldilineaceae bacterium]